MEDKKDENKDEDKVEGTENVGEDQQMVNPIEEAKIVNTKKEELLEREEKLQARKEKLHAEEMVSGKGKMTVDAQKEETPTEYTTRIMKNE